MLRVLHYRDLLFRYCIITRKPTTIIHFDDLKNQNPHLRFISNIPESTNQSSFTVDYLVNRCGLPPEKALSAANKFHLCSIEKADSVISLFESYGLTKTHITKLIFHRPDLLSYDPNKKLKPKFEFLKNLGGSGSLLSKLITDNPSLLTRSLENHFIPHFNFLKSYISTDAGILIVFKRCSAIFNCNLEKTLKPNISILQVHGVPDRNISKLLISQPRTLIHKSDSFMEIVENVKKMGFNPLSPMFFHAVRTVAGLSKSNWERKLKVYREVGWSDNDILSAFKKQPFCMLLSEEKIRRGMEFFLEKLKCKPTDISERPALLLYSLEKRIVPRCAVLKILYSEGLIRKKLNLGTVLRMAEREFSEKFVIEYQETVPQVMKAYKGGIEFAGFGEVVQVKELYMEPGTDHTTPSKKTKKKY